MVNWWLIVARYLPNCFGRFSVLTARTRLEDKKKGEIINKPLPIRCTDTSKRNGRTNKVFLRVRSYTWRSIPPSARDGALNEKRDSSQPSFIRKCPRIGPSVDYRGRGTNRVCAWTGKYAWVLTYGGSTWYSWSSIFKAFSIVRLYVSEPKICQYGEYCLGGNVIVWT